VYFSQIDELQKELNTLEENIVNGKKGLESVSAKNHLDAAQKTETKNFKFKLE